MGLKVSRPAPGIKVVLTDAEEYRLDDINMILIGINQKFAYKKGDKLAEERAMQNISAFMNEFTDCMEYLLNALKRKTQDEEERDSKRQRYIDF